MDLKSYLFFESIPYHKFAYDLQISPKSVDHLANERRLPSPALAQSIYEATGGKVKMIPSNKRELLRLKRGLPPKKFVEGDDDEGIAA